MMVDYNFYTNTYGGDKVTEAVFPKFLREAETALGLLSYGNIKYYNNTYGIQPGGGDFVAFTSTELEELQMGLCAMVDALYTLHVMEAEAIAAARGTSTGSIQSRTSGGESVTYRMQKFIYDEALLLPDAKQKLLKRELLKYVNLHDFTYNPFYAGLDSTWT